jgi:ribonuclease HI
MAQESRFELGHGTNNEAEFEALIRALQNLREISHRTGVDLAITSVRVITDSMIVRNRMMTALYRDSFTVPEKNVPSRGEVASNEPEVDQDR